MVISLRGLKMAGLKMASLVLASFQKLSVQLREICHPIGEKDWNSPVLNNFKQIQKLFALSS
jgi:hypothetical protein